MAEVCSNFGVHELGMSQAGCSSHRAYAQGKESVSLTGMHIAIVLSAPTLVFVTVAVVLSFRKARQDNPQVFSRSVLWMLTTRRFIRRFT